MTTSHTLTMTFWLISATTTLGVPPAAEWTRHYDSGERFGDAVEYMALGPGGTITVAGASQNEDLIDDIATARYDADGNELWVARYNGTLDWIDVPAGLGVDAGGNAYVLGTTWGGYNHNGGGEWDYILVKYSPTGAVEWTHQYDGPLHWSDTPTGLAVDEAGNAYVCGYVRKERDQYDRLVTHLHVVKFNTLGGLDWEIFYDLDPHQGAGAEDIRLTPDGNIVVTGLAEAPPVNSSNDDVITMKVSPAGDILWVQQWDSGGSNKGLDISRRVRTDRFNNVYTLAQHMSDDIYRHLDGTLIRYSPEGVEEWVAVMDFERADGFLEMIDDEEGNLYLSGGWDSQTDLNGLVISYTSDGQERWRRIFDGPDTWDYQFANSIMRGPDGLLYVGLDYQWPDAAGYDFTVAVLDDGGNELDMWRYDTGSSSDTFVDVDGYVMDDAGNIFIGGYSWFDLTKADFSVLKIATQSQSLAGDFDGDGDVDQADLGVLLSCYGVSDCGDLDGDGDTDQADLGLLLANYGT